MKNKVIISLCCFLLIVFSCNKSSTVDDGIYEEDSYHFSTPESQGVSSSLLNNAYRKATSLGFVDGIIVAKNGYIIGEKYYNGFTKSTPHNVKSVSKSILSAITYFAINDNLIHLNDKILDYFPEYKSPNLDTRKSNITIENLLTMKMGIPAEFDNNYTVYTDLYNSNNWVEATINLPLKYSPGTTMSYNTFQTHLLSVIIKRASQKSTLDFATENLFKSINIDIDQWEQDAQGNYFGGNSMFFTPREMFRFGSVYLNNGKLNNQQIIPESWINLTLTNTSNFSNLNIGAFKNYNYGYLWWLGEINNKKVFLAYGYAGQLIVLIPNLNAIIVTTTNNKVNSVKATNQEVTIFNFISEHLLPAFE